MQSSVQEKTFTVKGLQGVTYKYNVSYGDFLANHRVYLDSFLARLRACSFEGFLVEIPGVSKSTLATKQFEFSLINYPVLGTDTKPDTSSFRNQLYGKRGVVVFPNKTASSLLVVPANTQRNFSTIKAFTVNAPLREQEDFWSTVWSTLQSVLTKAEPRKCFWVSTHGLGVAWLHVRIDTEPKYYTHEVYKQTGCSNRSLSGSRQAVVWHVARHT